MPADAHILHVEEGAGVTNVVKESECAAADLVLGPQEGICEFFVASGGAEQFDAIVRALGE